MTNQEFQQLVWDQGSELYRSMRWRDEPTLYYVLVSELMLQQTQVARVKVKFDEFISIFPTVDALASANLATVLRAWQGLGYNRRAKFLHDAAKYIIVHDEPRTMDDLIKLPGVGKNTAGAIMNYVYQVPTAFVETNIRTVYLHHFFADETNIADSTILAQVEATIDCEHPREWFWALMDYGAILKVQGVSRLSQSKHYKKQSPLRGSVREIRGKIIATLTIHSPLTQLQLQDATTSDPRFEVALTGLVSDGLVHIHDGQIDLTK